MTHLRFTDLVSPLFNKCTLLSFWANSYTPKRQYNETCTRNKVSSITEAAKQEMTCCIYLSRDQPRLWDDLNVLGFLVSKITKRQGESLVTITSRPQLIGLLLPIRRPTYIRINTIAQQGAARILFACYKKYREKKKERIDWYDTAPTRPQCCTGVLT